MGVENKLKSSKVKLQQRLWFWPTIYGSLAVLLIIGVLTFNNMKEPSEVQQPVTASDPEGTTIPVTSTSETMKYPLKESLLSDVQILQHYYDVGASVEQQQNALLVFNQTFVTSQGISISVKGEPFEAIAAMSGKIKTVRMDPFTGNEIVIEHQDGYTTVYNSVADIMVVEGDTVEQGQVIAKTIENEANPYAGIHLHFKVLKNGEYINPTSLLAF